jgi:hypothetical protein
MARSGANFGRKREQAIAALMTQRNVEEAARVVGIGKRTLYRWLQDPEFQDAYREANRCAFSQSMARLQYASSAAVTTQLNLLVNSGTPASVKARVADSVLNHAMKANEIEDSQARARKVQIEKDVPTQVCMELLGILRGLAGAGFCARERLGDPPGVTAPPEDHRQESDKLQEFLGPRCIVAAKGDVG